jgi:hypothetical protein
MSDPWKSGDTAGATNIMMAAALDEADLGDERRCIETLVADGWHAVAINAYLDAAIDHARARRAVEVANADATA